MKRLAVVVVAVLVVASLAGCADVGDPIPLEAPASSQQDALDVQLAIASGGVDWQAALHNDTPLQSVEVHASPLPFSPGNGEITWNATDPAASGFAALDLPPGTWHLRVRVEDQAGREAWSSQQTFTVAAPSPYPLVEVDAGEDQHRSDADGDGQQTFQLSGTARTGPGQGILAYVWLEDGTRLSSSPLTTFTRPVGEHTFTFQVSYRDAQGVQGVATDDVRVTIAENQAPTADAGPDQTIPNAAGQESVSVALDGLASNDADGAIQSFSWNLAGQTKLTTATGTVSVPADAENVATHAITLTVTDDGGATATDTLTVKVNPPGVPVAHAGADITVLDEDDDGSENVTLDGSVSFDPDGTITSYSWTDASGAVVATTPKVNVALDVGVHTFELTVQNEAGKTDADEVNVTVGAPEPLQAVFTHDCNGLTCTFDASGSTGDPPLVFAWEFGDGGDATGVAPQHTFATRGTYPVQLTVMDGLGRAGSMQAGVGIGDPIPPQFPFAFTNTLSLGCELCTVGGPFASIGYGLSVQGLDSAWFSIPEESRGHPFRLGGTDDPNAFFFDDVACSGSVVESAVAPGPDTGTVPAEASCVVVYSATTLTLLHASITLTIEHTDAAMRVTSSAFPDGGSIPGTFSCRAPGGGVSPPIDMQGIPAGTQSLALVMEDKSSNNYTHWVLAHVPVDNSESASFDEGQVPPGTVVGANGAGQSQYMGVCPLTGTQNAYRFTVYALDADLGLSNSATKQAVRSAMQGHVIETAVLTGVYYNPFFVVLQPSPRPRKRGLPGRHRGGPRGDPRRDGSSSGLWIAPNAGADLSDRSPCLEQEDRTVHGSEEQSMPGRDHRQRDQVRHGDVQAGMRSQQALPLRRAATAHEARADYTGLGSGSP